MGRRGRAPKPTALRILHGDEEREINRNEPVTNPGLPQPPSMGPAAMDIWLYVVGELAQMGLVKTPDRDQLHAYVEAVRVHAEACKATTAGGVLLKGRDGALHVNPAIRVQTASARTMLILAREFGLTPASRVQFHAEEIAGEHAERLLS